MASRSRWLVGSSSTIRSCSPTSALASATRLAWPPESSSVRRSNSGWTPSDVATAATSHATPLSPRPPSVQPRYSATVPGGSRGSWSSEAMRTPRPKRTVPSSGDAAPVNRRNSVDLPDPLMPTTATRSPLEIVTERSSNRTLSGWATPTRSASTQIMAPRYGRQLADHSRRPRPTRDGWTGADGALGEDSVLGCRTFRGSKRLAAQKGWTGISRRRPGGPC